MPKTKPAKTTKKQLSQKKQTKTKDVKINLSKTLVNQIAKPKNIPVKHQPIANAFNILTISIRVLKQNWKLFALIIVTYGVLNILLVHGLGGNTNLSNIKSTLNQAFKGNGSQFGAGFTLFVYLLSSSGNSTSADGGLYQTILIIIVSLATIWTLRQVYAKTSVRMRDGFYRGMYPFIPFILLLLIIGLQLVPLLLGGLLYATVISNGIAVYLIEKLLWGALFLFLALLSMYMLSSSLFALYIVTLPDMTPMKALRSARQLVKGRRWIIMRKILFLPVALIIITAVIMLPLILLITPVAAWVFFVLTMVGLIFIHSYMYALYRELIS